MIVRKAEGADLESMQRMAESPSTLRSRLRLSCDDVPHDDLDDRGIASCMKKH